eukprot:gene9997-biopygen12283
MVVAPRSRIFYGTLKHSRAQRCGTALFLVYLFVSLPAWSTKWKIATSPHCKVIVRVPPLTHRKSYGPPWGAPGESSFCDDRFQRCLRTRLRGRWRRRGT